MRIRKNVKLAKYTTFHLGGPAKYFAEINNVEELKEAADFAKKNKLKTFVLGGGSNVLLPDKGINGLVLAITIKGVEFEVGETHTLLSAGAGEVWDKIVARAVKQGLGGIENLSLVPGTVGGAVYQNIGAYGVELKDVLESVDVFDIKTGIIKTISKGDCQFGYRDSVFQRPEHKDSVIVMASLRLSPDHPPKINYPDLIKYFENKIPTTQEIRKAIIKIRRSKLVYPTASIGTAGSFFKNPVITSADFEKLISDHPDIKGRDVGDGLVKLFAGQLTEKAGWKGKISNNVGVSKRHSMVLVSYKGAKSKDILTLNKNIQKSVKNKFGISLEPEVRIVT